MVVANDLPVAIGTVIAGKYRVDRVLGVGGMGIVAVGRHLGLDVKIAIKMLLPSVVLDREMVGRFVREARAVTRVTSEHAVKVIDVGTMDHGPPFMVMEYLEGSDLSQILKARGKLPPAEAVDYILQACEALAEAHGLGIVHRDIKPANLFLARRADGTPLVKVLDFGVSKLQRHPEALAAEELTRSDVVIGSPHYMSPEQLRAPKEVDARADIWALGAVLFKLIAGRAPFTGTTSADLHVAVLARPAPRLADVCPDVPPELDAVVTRCLQKDAAERFATIGDLAQALAPIASEDAQSSIRTILRVTAAPKSVSHSSAPPPPPSNLPSARLSSSSISEVSGSASANSALDDNSVSVQVTIGASTSGVRREPRRRVPWIAIAVPLVFAAVAASVALGVRASRFAPASTTKPLASPVASNDLPPSTSIVAADPVASISPEANASASAAPPSASAIASTSKSSHVPPNVHASHPAGHPTSSPTTPAKPTPSPASSDGLSEFGGRT